MSAEQDKQIAAKGRHIGLVIAGTMVIWLVAQFIGGQMGWPGRFALLFDFFALAALIYAGVNIVQLRRMRRDSKG
ncbi:DUF5337 domain-containing protein [Aestuariivita sp.]|jgi:hypothetical protein|uniref:DUF5337 domain-containing protein n=1 Tax=Aestuariivita sp. TaxID=1872407 RepID=UPI0021702840|nr:DUF5337 domain-containing protein [Aestuariivita sp.]MCE8008830.1 DUF5337 domain-containing protein [Aestuariivita sp.]